MTGPHQTFGQPILRVDGFDKLTGRALYAGDLSSPGMLHLKVRWSDRPHAKILGIRTEEAERCPGVVRVFTHRDIPGSNRVGPRIKDQPVLCDDKVRHMGDPVALVAAESLEAAREAMKLIRVDYEDLPGLFSPEEALSSGAPRIHESGNLLLERTLLKGDPDAALERADRVIANTYRTQRVEPACLEPEAGFAKVVGDNVTVWMPSKHAHFEQKEIATVLGLPLERVRVVLTTIGGSFGDKQCLSPGYYAAVASVRTGRPCKMVYTREESFFSSTNRHPFLIHYETAVTREGRILAVRVEILADTGAYSSYGPSVLVRAMIHAAGPYEIPNVSVTARAVYTNNPVAGAMRGFGVAQMAIAHETQMDCVAKELRMDPFELRQKNGLKPGSVTATGQYLGSSVGLSETLNRVRAEIAARDLPPASATKRYGWGIASMYYGIGLLALPNPGISRMEAAESGDFTLFLGCGDVGQGSATVMTQIAAEELRSDARRICLVMGDTYLCPDSGTSTASRVTYVVGRSVQLAAENLRHLLQERAASMIEIDREDLVMDRGSFYPKGVPQRRVSVGEVVGQLKRDGIYPVAMGIYDPETTPLDPKSGQGVPFKTYAFATHGALVSVDVGSGEIEVLDLVACHDVGKVVHPTSIVGQIEGGVSMGLGYGLMEETILERGEIRNPDFRDYLVPTPLDMPNVTSILVEAEEPTGPFGAKGIGEPVLIPTAPAILNALYSATGVRFKEIPVTSERLWRALNDGGASTGKTEAGVSDWRPAWKGGGLFRN